MKDAFYVPDALWQVASDLFPTDGTSALVQRGLRALLREWADTPELAEIVEAMTDEKLAELIAE